MTNDTSKPRLVGSVLADGEGGDVFEENGVFYSVGTSMVIAPDDREVVVETRSADFPSLEAFMQSLPRGVRFVTRS
jgi:hypothetical protein